MTKIKSFTDLTTWQESHKLDLLIYEAIKTFPKSETYSLVDQLRRCSVSVSSNIAEGFSRKSDLEKQQFYYRALASLTELQNQILIAKDVQYINQKTFNLITSQTIIVSKLINSLIKYLNSINT